MTRYLLLLAVSLFVSSSIMAEDWPQWMGTNRDGRWSETGTISKFKDEKPNVLWRTTIGGGYTGPAVADGKVYVMDFVREEGELKNNPNGRNRLKGRERTVCLDAKTGSQLWKDEYPCVYGISYACGPRCTPTVADGKVYSLGAEGNLRCLDAKTGSLVWAKELKTDYQLGESPIWGFSSHPLVFENKLILAVGAKEGILVALDKNTGKEIWKALPAKDSGTGYCPPDVIEVGGKKQIIFWSPEELATLKPETGEVIWKKALKPSYGMSIMAPRKSGDFIFAGGIGPAGVCLKLEGDKPTEVWQGQRTVGVHPVNATPIIEDGIIYGCDQPGQLRGVELATGKQLWETFEATTKRKKTDSGSGTAFLVKNGDKYFIFNETGELIIAKLSKEKYEELSKVKILEPTGEAFGRAVVWSHPAFANKCCFARNDKEIICVSLAE